MPTILTAAAAARCIRATQVRRTALLLLASFALSSCGDPAGTDCMITGSGFHASDDCRHKCLSRWSLICPGDERVTPNTCSGAFGCEPGGCPDGQVCYHDNDPFDDRSFCVAANSCGDLSAEELANWEAETLSRQRAVQRERAEKQARRAKWQAEQAAASGKSAAQPAPTAVTAEPQPQRPAPVSEPAPPAEERATPAGPALACERSDDRDAFYLQSLDSEAGGPVTLAKGQTFERALPNDWKFVLQPVEHGFTLRIDDRSQNAGAIDLSAVTPPLRSPVNARHILGWHFRNADNSGPNTGDVNAPQQLRLFSFDPDMTGRGAGDLLAERAAEAGGRGWLRIESLELSPPAAGERASIETMTFRACLTWPRPSPEKAAKWQQDREASLAAAYAANLDYDDTDRELFGACGLDFDEFELEALFGPRLLQLDIDGDDAIDTVGLARRLRDGERGVALCRAGTWFEWLGAGQALTSDPVVAHTLSSLEAWYVAPGDRGAFGYVDEPPWPAPDGNVLVLERIEKSLVVLYFSEDALRAHRVYSFVEP